VGIAFSYRFAFNVSRKRPSALTCTEREVVGIGETTLVGLNENRSWPTYDISGMNGKRA
jgi:hypothetical protein